MVLIEIKRNRVDTIARLSFEMNFAPTDRPIDVSHDCIDPIESLVLYDRRELRVNETSQYASLMGGEI